MYVLNSRRMLAAGCFLTIGCNGFKVADYPDEQDLYRESLRRLEAGDGRAAITGFERLTLELPARDTLLPRSHYYLGRAHAREKEWLLAAQAYSRLSSLFPDDTLADDGLFEAGRAYATIWDDPELDPTYGHSAIAMFESLIATYPSSSLVAQAEAAINKVKAQLAEKEFRIAEHYRTRKSPHSAIKYYKELIQNYPNAPRVPDAYARMATVYESIGYEEDLQDTCEAARERFAAHPAVRAACAGAPVTSAPPPPTPGVASPPPAGGGSPPPSRAPPRPASSSSASAR